MKGAYEHLEGVADGSGLSGVSNAHRGRAAVTPHPGGNGVGETLPRQ